MIDEEYRCMYLSVHFITYLIIDHHSIVTVQEITFQDTICNKLLIPRFPLHQATFPTPIRQNFWITVRCNQRCTWHRVNLLVKESSWRTKLIQSFCKSLEEVPSHQDIKFPNVQKREHNDIFERRKGQGFVILQSLASLMVPHQVVTTALWSFTCNCPAPLQMTQQFCWPPANGGQVEGKVTSSNTIHIAYYTISTAWDPKREQAKSTK